MPSKTTIAETRWRGKAAAPGIAHGPAFVFSVASAEPPVRRLTPRDNPKSECERLEAALSAVGSDIQAMRERAPDSVGSALAKIFEAQLLIVDDAAIRADAEALITKERLSAESAFSRIVTQAQRAITSAPDPYLREMAGEIRTVKNRVLNRLMGLADSPATALSRPSVLLAHTITPTELMDLNRDLILGIVVETGGPTSHTAIFAKSLGIPAVLGVGRDVRVIPPGTSLVVNGFSGVVIVDPDEHTIAFIERKKKRARSPWPKKLDALRELPAVTQDGHTLALYANIDLGDEVALARAAGAGGIGLYRTEYLYLQRGGYPSEARQRTVYRKVAVGLEGRPLIVRTFDLGSDKVSVDAPAEANPALGIRGVRISLSRPKTLAVQFRALLAASADGAIAVMVPMISSVEEFVAAKREWRKAKSQLKAKNIPFDPDSRFGLMIETPAAVSLAPELANEADFFSIGTNDLLQYTTAADRGNPRLSHLHSHWHPALWRQIAVIVRAGHDAGIPVGVCGEVAGDPLALPALLGLKVDSISSHPNSIPRLKSLVRRMRLDDCEQLIPTVLTQKTAGAIQTLLREFNRNLIHQSAGDKDA
jgi:phosphotransferase system enzyme I (PtsI)